nr:retrotransposable element Tf2 [Tanacetum cinerariifolium]
EISMDFVTGLPQTQRRHDAIWVVVDRLTKSAHFLPIRKDYSVSRLAEIFQQEIVRLHGTPSTIVSDRDPRFASRFWKGLQKAWGTRLKFSTAFHPQKDGQSERTIQTLEDMLRSCALEKCRAPICWDQVGERVIEGPKIIEVTNAKVAIAKEKLKEARTRQKSYTDKHRRSLEFQPALKVEIQLKDIAIKELRRKLEVAQKEKDSIQHKVDKFESASKSLNKLIDCQIVNNCKKGLGELRKKLETVQREKDGIQLTVEKLENALKSLNKLIDSQIVDNCKKGLGYNAVPPPHTGLFMPPKSDLSYIGLEEFTIEHAVETLNANTSKEVSKVVKKDNGAPIIKDWKSDYEDESVSQPKIEKKTVKPSVAKIEFVKPKQQSQNARKTIKNVKKI